MTSTLPLPTPPGEPSSESCRAVVFTTAEHYLALPLTAVVKVIPATALEQVSSVQSSLIYLDGQPITLLNLQSCLSVVAPNQATARSSTDVGPFLLIASNQEQLFAISTHQVPTLMDLPLVTIRALPQSYRQSIQNIAVHVAVLTHQVETQTILLLDLQQAMKAQDVSIPSPRPLNS